MYMVSISPITSNHSMASSPDVNRSLKEALYETLNGILSPHHDIRIAAEERIQALEVTEDFGIHLAEFTVDSDGPLPVRQLASVLLKQYVETHWCNYSSTFQPPETTEHAKVTIKELLPLGLKESISKVRSSVAYAISAIAHWDWPENWPGLFDILINYLSSGNEWAVHGAMRVLTEFSRDLTDMQLPHIAPVILSEMYRIFQDEQKYSVRIRGRAVEIFSTCVCMISAMSGYNNGVTRTLLNPVLPSFSERFVHGLQVPDGIHSDSCLKTDIIKALALLVKRVPRQISPWLPQILPPVWQTLTHSADIYLKTIVNGTEAVDEIVDSDGEVLGFENLVFSIFEFVNALVDGHKLSMRVESVLTDLLYYLILFMQITEEQVRVWTANPNQFVEDEDEKTFAYSVRISAQDLLLTLCSEFEDNSCSALCQAVTRHVQEAETAQDSNNGNWWKIHEACMLALGSAKSVVVQKLDAGEVVFDLTGFLQNVVITDMNSSGSPFLLGRCLWVGSRYAHFMSTPMIEQFLEATVSGLQPSQVPSIRISAVRARFEIVLAVRTEITVVGMWYHVISYVDTKLSEESAASILRALCYAVDGGNKYLRNVAVRGFCEHLKNSNNTQMLVSLLPSVTDNLLGMATQYSCEVLSLVLETLALVLSIDRNFAASCESRVTSLAIAVFLKYNSDPVIIALVQDVFKELSQNPECLSPLQQRLVPTLVSILNAPADKIPSGLHAVALDVLQTLVRYSEPPLSATLMNTAFPAAVQCMLRTDDNSTMQTGGECLRTYISIAPEQVFTYQDNEGHTGLWYSLQVAALLLNPSSSEYTATFVGRLIITLITKAGNILGENLDLLLKAVLSKMQRAETLSVIQSLVMVYAHLIHTQLDAVLNFLSTVPGPTGQSALQFVLTEWCSRQHLFYGAYEQKISTVALCKLLEHGIASNDIRLNDITVKGDEVFVTDGIRTRSQSQNHPPQWTHIPLLVKIYKLLVNELSVEIELNMARDEDEEETDEEWEDDELARGEQGVSISQLLEESDYKAGTEDTGDDKDPDALQDPVYHINIQQYLTEFLQSFSQQPYFHAFLQHLNKQEKQVLESIGVRT